MPRFSKMFKPRASTATNQLLAGSYGWSDVRNTRSAVAWAQNMLRLAQAAEIVDPIQQLRMVWMRIDPSLQRDVSEPTNGTTVAAFMQQLDQRYGQWLDMTNRTSRRRPERQGQGRPEQRPRANIEWQRQRDPNPRQPRDSYQHRPWAADADRRHATRCYNLEGRWRKDDHILYELTVRRRCLRCVVWSG